MLLPRIESKKYTYSYAIVDGFVEITIELKVKDINLNKWGTAGRSVVKTGKTKAELRAEYVELRAQVVTNPQSVIDALDAL